MDEIPTYNFPKDEYFGLEVIENNVKYELIVRLSSTSKGLICFGSGLIDQKTKKLPRFQRYRWKDKFEESIIYYNDPTLYLNPELEVGWFIGSEDDWYLEKLSKIIKNIITLAEIKEEMTLFYGTSNGGFVSTALATLINGSTALVGNFNYSIYRAHIRIHIDRMEKHIFNGLDEKTILKKHKYRLNVVELFKREKHVPSLIYHLNGNSKVDIIGQCIPFIRDLEKLDYSDNDIEIIIGHDENGHRSRTKFEEAYPLIQMVLKRKIYRYNTKSPLPDKNLEAISRENHELKVELNKLKTKRRFKFGEKFQKLKQKVLSNKFYDFRENFKDF